MLTIENVTKIYGNNVKALNQLSLDIQPGLFGLLGPNGAGKSSLMRTIATLQKPTEGAIRFEGKDVFANQKEFLSTLGYLPQDFGVYPSVSAEKLLDYFAVLKGLTDNRARSMRVQSLLEQTNLFAHRQENVCTYSGGMRQRFGIAVAMLTNPTLLIVDEPTAGLDPGERNRFHRLLTLLGDRVTILLSTHIVEDVSHLCKDLAIVCKGAALEKGKPADLIKRYSGKIWACEDKDEEQDKAPVISRRFKAGRVYSHCFSEVQPGENFDQVMPDLEDVYFATLFKAEGQQALGL